MAIYKRNQVAASYVRLNGRFMPQHKNARQRNITRVLTINIIKVYYKINDKKKHHLVLHFSELIQLFLQCYPRTRQMWHEYTSTQYACADGVILQSMMIQ